jgi:hypothetical protein
MCVCQGASSCGGKNPRDDAPLPVKLSTRSTADINSFANAVFESSAARDYD